MCDAYPVSEDDENPVFSGSTTTHGFSGSTTTHQRHGSSASEPRSSFSLRRSLRATLPVESAAEVVAPQTDRMQDSGLMNRRDQQEARSESGFSKNRFSENQLRVQHLLHEDEEEEEEDHDAVVVGSLEESRLCFAPMFGEQDGDDIINGGSNNDGGGREEENDATISLFLHSVIGGLPGEHEQGHDFRKNDFSAAAWTDDRAGRLQKSTTLLEDSGGTRIPEAGAPDGRWGDGKEKRSFSWGEKVEAVRDAPSMNTSVNTGSPLLLAGRYPTTTAAQFVNQRNSLHFSLDLAQKHTGNLANQSLLEALQHFGIARSGKEDQTAIPPGNGGAPASKLRIWALGQYILTHRRSSWSEVVNHVVLYTFLCCRFFAAAGGRTSSCGARTRGAAPSFLGFARGGAACFYLAARTPAQKPPHRPDRAF